jgi:hypothetical protein
VAGSPVASIVALQALGARSAAIAHISVASYYEKGAGGGGVFDWNATSTAAPDGCIVFAADTVATGRWVRAGGNKALSVLDCGAWGDGATDDANAEQAAIAAVAANGRLTWPSAAGCYLTRATLIVAKPLTLTGRGKICWSTVGKAGFSVTSGGVVFDGLTLNGPQDAAYHGGEDGIDARGTFHTGAAPDYIANVTVKNCVLANWGDTGLLTAFVSKLTVTGNTLRNMVYAGVALQSVSHAEIRDNVVNDVSGADTPNHNAYGIYISRASGDTGNLTSQPRSDDVIVSSNRIDGVPTWEGLDTHAGTNVVFSDNTVTRARFGIGVGSSTDNNGIYTYAPLNVSVTGNHVDSGVTDGSAAYGLSFEGCSTEMATGLMKDNTAIGFGLSGAISGAVNIGQTRNLVVSGNIVRDPSPTGIFLSSDNDHLTLSDNLVIGPWTNEAGVGEAIGIRSVGNNNVVAIMGNRFQRSDKRATYLLTTPSGLGMRFSSGTGNRVTLGTNQSDATSYMYDQAGAVISGASPR